MITRLSRPQPELLAGFEGETLLLNVGGQSWSMNSFAAADEGIRSRPSGALRAALVGLLALGLSGCLSAETAVPAQTAADKIADTDTDDSDEDTVVTPDASVPKSARVIFKQANPSGSFEPAPAGGTREHLATRLFNPDGSILAEDMTDADWPGWISSISIGITGTGNGNTDPNCARFATNAESNSTCNLDRNTATPEVPCGAPSGYYRVSEINCLDSAVTDGTGSDTDLISVRVKLNRDNKYLASNENLMIVIEYAASALNPAPADPTKCMVAGIFDPTQRDCSDMSYQFFVKHSASETLQPFLTLVPPALSHIRTDLNSHGNGMGTATKQIFVPLAADSDLSIIQLSRIRALGSSEAFTTSCANDSGAAVNGSAYCVGMVFYSMTLFRI